MNQNLEAQARRILHSAGVDPDVIEETLAEGKASVAQRIVDDPQAAPALAAKFPARSISEYEQAREAFGFEGGVTADTFAGAGGADAMARNAIVKKGYQTNESGALLYENGVIADPSSRNVYFPANDESVPGSFAWLENVQEEWDEEKINEWRKRLSQYGYDISDSGPIDQVFLTTLQAYHRDRYLNGGKAVPLDASRAGKTGEDRIFDPAQLRNAIRQKFRVDWGDDPSEAELESWEKFTRTWARKMVQQGYSPEQAGMAAEERFIEKFESDPKLQFFQEAEEEKTELRDSLLGVLQSINSVARSA